MWTLTLKSGKPNTGTITIFNIKTRESKGERWRDIEKERQREREKYGEGEGEGEREFDGQHGNVINYSNSTRQL